MPKADINPKIETRLSTQDMKRLKTLADKQQISKSEIARKAIRWYLDNFERLANEEKETAYAAQLKNTTSRLAAMLYRIGVSVQSLYEFQWSILNNDGKDVFESCVTKAKEKLRSKLVEDERAVIDAAAKRLSS